MKKRVSVLLLLCFVLAGVLCACSKKNNHGKFYPYNMSAYVKLGEYRDISYLRGSVSVDTNDVEDKIREELEKYKLTTQKEKNAAAASGDTVNIDFVGYLNGEAYQGGSAKGETLKIGSGLYIDGFESGLIGKKAGDKVKLELTFPKTYENAKFAGKDVVFDVTINTVYETVYPKLTDDIVSRISTVKTVADYREYIYESLVESETAKVEQNNRNNFVAAVIEACEIKKYPQKEVKKYQSNLIEQYEQTAQNEGLTLESFVRYNGYTMDEFDELMKQNAQNLVAKEMVFLMIADEEGISVSQEEFETGIESYMDKNGYISRETFLEDIGEDKFRGLLLVEKTIEQLKTRMEAN